MLDLSSKYTLDALLVELVINESKGCRSLWLEFHVGYIDGLASITGPYVPPQALTVS